MHFNKFYFSTVLVLTLIAHQCIAATAADSKAPNSAFKSEADSISYTIGASVGRNFKKEGVVINQKVFIEGFNDALSGTKLKITEQEFKSVLTNFQRDMHSKMVANQRELGMKNKKKEADFLAENAKKKGVVTLASGLQYIIVKAGNGVKPQDSDMIEVNYRGTLLDGTEFDASQPGKPVSLKLAQTIAGWKEALKLMPTGSKWQLFIPAKYAYGERGVGSDIGPSEMLIFDIELLNIKK
ncbi:MAG: FKBP-type peptidyl-prolyl cis-trans isomerase [Methylococcaceae bacterium]|nr:FKBP-type peptidyl-prolyl cis-trans isomerase [Methylococcaceae bacterium]